MVSKPVASAPMFLAKLLRHQLHRQPNLLTTPLALANRSFSAALPLRSVPSPDDYEPNPFLRTGEAGHCRVDKTEKDCSMRIDVPGVAEDDVKVWTEPGSIYFHAKDSEIPQYQYDGRTFGGAIRFDPKRYDSDGVKAEVKNGVLWLSVPRMEN